MRTFLAIIALIPFVSAFAPQTRVAVTNGKTTQLNEAINRRDASTAAIAGILASVMVSFPTSSMAAQRWQFGKDASEMWQQNPMGGDKIDINTAPMGDYKQFKEMYPSVAAKVASNGPYSKVSDVYEIDDLTGGDRKVLKKYENLFTVNPAGRDFKEKMNARFSS